MYFAKIATSAYKNFIVLCGENKYQENFPDYTCGEKNHQEELVFLSIY